MCNNEFNPSHKNRKGVEFEVLDEAEMMSIPHDGLVCTIYRDSKGKNYVMMREEFLHKHESIIDPIERAIKDMDIR